LVGVFALNCVHSGQSLIFPDVAIATYSPLHAIRSCGIEGHHRTEQYKSQNHNMIYRGLMSEAPCLDTYSVHFLAHILSTRVHTVQQPPGKSEAQLSSSQASVIELAPAGQHLYFCTGPSLPKTSLAPAKKAAEAVAPTTMITAAETLSHEICAHT
jgi:hypothetical protein